MPKLRIQGWASVRDDALSCPPPSRHTLGKRSGMTTEQVLALPGFRDRCTDASSAVYEDRRLAVRDDHPLDRQLRDPLE
jgi:hypothetical protein